MRKWLWPALGLTAWVGALGFGFHALWKYKADPAEQGRPPVRWPVDSRLAHDRDRPTLVMFAHPRCPCTAASLTELRNLIARVGARVRPYVVVYRPAEVGSDWDRAALWSRSELIPGVTVVRDDDGREAQRFQAFASGLVVLYDRQGRRVFDGGLTASRGHEGDSFGRRRILAVLDGVTPDRDQSPVFGCAIAGAAAETEVETRTVITDTRRGMTITDVEAAAAAIVRRAEARLATHRDDIYRGTDRVMAWLMAGQWVFAILIAVIYSPYAWEGKVRTVHAHVWAAVLLGGALSSLPIALAVLRPGWWLTRHVVAAAQMLWSALLIHLTGGRIESHFHVFGSLGILAAYRDWRVLLTATVVVAADHLVRGLAWPESVYGIVNPEWWRFLEHAFWVVFAISFLIVLTLRSLREMRLIAERGAEPEALSEGEWRRTSVLDRDSQRPVAS